LRDETSTLVVDLEYPLSPMQQGMLFHGFDRRETGVDVQQVLCTLGEKLDVAQFVAAWNVVISRYDILRTSFEWEGRAEPAQRVHHSVDLPLQTVDLTSVPTPEQRERVASFMAEDRASGFDLSAAPLMRVTVMACGPASYQVLWTFHHAILDGRSFPILLREVFAVYEAIVAGRPLTLGEPRQYRTYIEWLQTQDPERSKAFWKRRLAGFEAPTPLVGSVRGGSGVGVDRVELQLTEDETRALHAFARTAQCTLGTLVTAAWALLLNRYTGDNDVLFGVTRACRHSTVDGAEEMVGLFINTLPFRTEVGEDTTVFEWLAKLRAAQTALREHEHTPLSRIQSWSDVPRGTPLFDTLVVFENDQLETVLQQQGGAWANRRFMYRGQTNYPVTLVCYADRQLMLGLEYHEELLDGEIAVQMVQHAGRLLRGLAQDGYQRLGEICMLSVEEQTELLPLSPRPSGIQTFCLHERFERRTAETPDAPALTFDGRTITYEVLNRRANQLAHRLRALGVGPDDLVGVHLERSAELIVAILGILKAGGAYLPLDPAYPHERLQFMLEDAHVGLVVTTARLATGFPLSGAELVLVEDTVHEPTKSPGPVAEPDNLAYVIYTSGSTGKPKGVLITHANVSRLFDASDIGFQFSRDDVWTLFHSYAFDFSVWEIWGALLYGGRLVVVPYWVSRDPEAFIDLLAREHVTMLSQTPSAFRQLTDAEGLRPRRARFALRHVVLGGEALDVSSLRPWFERHGDDRPRVINMFGITETTVHVTYRRITKNDVEGGIGSVIGVPLADLDVYVLDPHHRLVPSGVAGEIYVGGAGVARGYLNRPDLTRARFVVDPVGGTDERLYRSGDLGRWLSSGELEYRGRIDDQVKIRGFRIELGEIEAVIRHCSGVRDVTVVALQESGVEKRLAAYVVLGDDASIDEVRRFIQAKLPEHMIPAVFVALEALPLTSNGKIDRRALPVPSSSRGGKYVAPRNETERTLADVWASVLRHDAVSVDDNFFELGGDSILSIQVIARCRQAGLQLSTRDMFQHPTVAALAAMARPSTVPSVQIRGAGDAPLTPILRWFFEQPLANRKHWNHAFFLEVPPDLDLNAMDAALQAIVAHHDAFRLRFVDSEAGWRAWHAPSHPAVAVERVDLANLPAELVPDVIDQAAASAQAGLDITEGPLVRAVHFSGSSAPARLLIVIHHVAVDAVSWSVLLEDLETAYFAAKSSYELQLPHRTTSFKFWAERLTAFAGSEAEKGLPHWIRPFDERAAALPCDRQADPAANTEQSGCTVTMSLTPSETEALLHRVPAVSGTRINDVLLAALVRAVAPWTGQDSVLVDFEGHGREDLFDDVDVSRTIGWFTSIFPVLLESGDGTPGSAITSVKDTLRTLPHRGLSFGALRYLSPNPDVRRALERVPRPQILFNYLGQLDAIASGSSLFRLTAESCTPWHALENRRSHLLEVLAQVIDGRLKIQWTYSNQFHDAATISTVAGRYTEALRELMDYCVTQSATIRTPADFPVANITQPELTELIARYPSLRDVYPLSTIQQLFYSMEGVEKSPGIEQWEFLLEGPLDVNRLAAAWRRVLERHPILRTAFVQLGSSKPHQVVLDDLVLPWQVRDWRDCGAEEQGRRLRELLDEERRRGFDLEQPPLVRVTVARVADAEYRLIWTTHHLLVDGWSWPLIFSELSELYADDEVQLPPVCGYREYISWLKDRDWTDDKRFWSEILGKMVDATPIPSMATESAEPEDQEVEVIRRLDTPTTSALALMARAHQVTLSTLISAAWSIVLSHHSGRSDVVFGASFAGRPEGVSGIERMIGPCVNNLPIVAHLDHQSRIGDWLRRLHAQIGELTSHQTTPLPEIHSCSGVPSWMRLFDSLLVIQNYIVDANVRLLADVRLRPVRCPEATNYPATIVVRPGEQLEVEIMRSGDRFGSRAASVAADDLTTILKALAVTGEATMSALFATLPEDSRGRAGRARMERHLRRGPRLAPRTEMEKVLTDIWRDVFEGDIGTDENYFELGMHSLMLMRAHERICAVLKADLPVAALFQYPTVRDLAAHLTANSSNGRRDADLRARAQQQLQAMARRKALAEAERPQ
jgi:amino acid adenylation domain-containing protein/non-ribosomal peptide synthase protein (TIGR01720 family)